MTLFETSRRAALSLALMLPLLLAAGPAPVMAAVAAPDKADVVRVETYLNSIKTLTAKFIQVAPDGSLSEGKAYMRRPGRMRFEYDDPVPVLLVADGLWMVFHDKQLKQTTRVPLGSSPLSVLLRDKIELDGAVTVKSVTRGPGTLRLVLYDTDKPKEGLLTLVFSDQPLALKQWVVTDEHGQNTTVSLSDVETNMYLQPTLFIFRDPEPRIRN